MQKQKLTCSPLPTFGKSISNIQRATVRHPKRTKKILRASTVMKLPKIGKKLSPISLLLLINLKTPKNVIEADKEIVQLLRSIPLR